MTVGDRLGDFEFLDELGRGGMGLVYRARQTSLEREVAVKVLPPELATQGHVAERFQAEARRMAKLSHPHIAQIYVVGEQDGTHYFAMQLLPGGTLEERLKRGPLGIEEAGKVAAEVADALEHAHAQGLTHRDIKPANILFDAQGHAVVTDFGIAKAADDVKLTATGMAVGTPQYMAPEQARGNPTDHRADIYALGAVMYEMVCGRPPFSGDTPVSIAMKHMRETPLPPQAFRGDVPEWLQSVILKALAKEPADRFSSAGDMAGAISAQAAVGPPPSPHTAPDFQRPRAAPGGTVVMPLAAAGQRSRVAALIGIAAMVGAGIIAGVALRGGASQEAPSAGRQHDGGSVDQDTGDGGSGGGPGPEPGAVEVTMPSVVGLSDAEACSALKRTGAFEVMYNSPRHSEDVSADCILAQDPGGGEPVERGVEVYLVKSLGPADPGGVEAAALRRRYDSWVSAWQAEDIGAFMSFYAPDVRIKRWKKPTHGHDALRRRMAEKWAQRHSISIQTRSLDVDVEGATATLRAVQRYEDSGWWDEGKKTLTWRKDGGVWMIVEEDFRQSKGGAK